MCSSDLNSLIAHHHVTKIVHGGNKAEAVVVNEVLVLALLSFLPNLRYVQLLYLKECKVELIFR